MSILPRRAFCYRIGSVEEAEKTVPRAPDIPARILFGEDALHAVDSDEPALQLPPFSPGDFGRPYLTRTQLSEILAIMDSDRA